MNPKLAVFLLLVPGIAFAGAASKKPTAPTAPSTKAQWRIKAPATTTSDAMDDHGSRSLPLDITTDCAAHFRVERLTYSMDAGDREALRRAFMGTGSISSLEIVVTKLFSGRGEPPSLTLIQERGTPMRFSLSNSININAWPRKGYRVVGYFEADKLQRPRFWTRLKVSCD